MITTVGELKRKIEDLPDDMPVKGELQGEENWDWSIFICTEEEIENQREDVLMISMDL